MSNETDIRAVELAHFIVDKKATVREAAKIFDVSKSTVHIDVTVRLKSIDPILYQKVREVLEVNKAQRHIRGGQATKEKYKTMNNE